MPIRLGFEPMADGTYQNLILHDVSKATIDHDIDVFLKHEFERIKAERRLPPTWPDAKDIQHLVQMAAPLFIFAATVLPLL
ncbi:hypothetical protein BP6252_02960 [Coleophoma cylindrospora]|uniref:Uncharacterized protein n=1 Tax=Coleophoma cylindrospora TaxID=1849047 RepID=A0A3D8S6E7_9HELO|nr:hypothetical protein BP6252_02960 [Coleophoma cylindrospora]